MAKKVEFSLETVKKYIFWPCILIAILFPAITTFLAVGSITQAFNNRKSALENTKRATETIVADRGHPNEITINDIQNCEKKLRGRVFRAWQTLENDQRARNVWPVDEIGLVVSEEISRLKFFDEMSVDALEKYLNFVQDFLPKLEVYVDRRRVQEKDPDTGDWKELDINKDIFSKVKGNESSGGGNRKTSSDSMIDVSEAVLPRGSDGKEIARYVGTVDWPNPETRDVVSSWIKLPKSNEVWFAQEEFWVYQALLSVVKESNIGATGPHNAVVKKIENLLIGQSASALLESRSSSRVSPAGSDDGGGGSESSYNSESGGAGGSGITVAQTEADVIAIKKHNRYVDDKARPLKANEESQFNQFKRMPICLRLIVDQRKIPEILVNCANCSMPIDVLWVRFNPAAVKPFELSAYDASVGAASGGGMSSGGRGGEGYGDSNSEGGDVQVRMDGIGGIGNYGSNAIPIEIYGCINIFNPVEHGGLQLESATSATPESAAP